jgi:hypothetical protein
VRTFGYGALFAAGVAERPAAARALLVAQTYTRPEWAAEFNDWYNLEHVPGLVQIPGCYRGRRFQSVEDRRHFVALYDLADPDAIAVEAHWALLRTPWANRILPRFDREFVAYCWEV